MRLRRLLNGWTISHCGQIERIEDALLHSTARLRRGALISSAVVESEINEIVARRMNSKQQMRWNRASVQPFLDVRAKVLNGALSIFRHC